MGSHPRLRRAASAATPSTARSRCDVASTAALDGAWLPVTATLAGLGWIIRRRDERRCYVASPANGACGLDITADDSAHIAGTYRGRMAGELPSDAPVDVSFAFDFPASR